MIRDSKGGHSENAGQKNALVTGASRGLGKALVERLCQDRNNVWACCRHFNEDLKNWAEELSKEYGVWVEIIEMDLLCPESVKEGIKGIFSEKKNIDILINNAGIGHMGLFQMTSQKLIRQIYEVNLFAPMEITQMVLRPMMKQKNGRIINVASTAASEVYDGNSIYGATKAALIAFTQSLAAEVMQYGITVNAIAPGLIDTDMAGIFENKDPDEPIRHMALGRKIQAKEIADTVMHLLSDDVQILNGSVITLNGGHK